MITSRLKRMLGCIFLYLEITSFGIWSPYHWDWKSERLRVTNPWIIMLRQVCMIAPGFIVIVMGARNLYRLWEVDINLEEAVIDGIYLGLEVVSCANMIMLFDPEPMASFINQMLDLDTRLQERFRGELIQKREPPLSAHIKASEKLVALMFLAPLLAPICFVVLFMTEYEPHHRFLRIFYIHPKPKLIYLPMMVFVGFSALMFAQPILIVFLSGFMYIQHANYWIPCATIKKEPKFINFCVEKDWKEETLLGRHDFSTLLLVYRSQQILNTTANSIANNVYVALHHVLIGLITILGTFAFIDFHHPMKTIVAVITLMILAIGIIYALSVEMRETVMVASIPENTKTFIKRLRDGVARKSYAWKCLRSLKPLHIASVGPFYKIERVTFLTFCQACVDYIVTLCVTF